MPEICRFYGIPKIFIKLNRWCNDMKLLCIEQLSGYHFSLVFAEDRFADADLEPLVGEQVKLSELKAARVDEEWGCLEFKGGLVDVEPKTLHRFCEKGI